jgi:hypothetical protein
VRIEIRLSDSDRERLGVSSEWIEYDHDKVGIRLLAEVQKTLGLTLPEFDRGIADGNAFAVWGLVWIAVRMAGIEVSIEEFDFQANVARYRRLDDAPAGLGKDPSTPSTRTPTSKRSETTKTSTRSSATARSRSHT